MVVFYHLKACYQGGIVLNYRKQLARIAESFGYASSKLRSYIAELKTKGWAQESNGHLTLISTRRFAELIGCQSRRTIRVDHKDLDQLALHLTARAIGNGLTQQRFKLHEKKLNQSIRAIVGIPNPEILSPAARRRYAKVLHKETGEPIRLKALPRYEQELIDNLPLKPTARTVNFDVTYSRRGLAAHFGFRSSSTGTRMAKKLVKAGLVTDQGRIRYSTHPELANGITYEHFRELKRYRYDYDPRYIFVPFKDGSGLGLLGRRLPNLIAPIPTPSSSPQS